MKRLLKYLTVVLILLVYACNDEETPSIIPVADFSQNRQFIEPGESVSFDNKSTDGISYSWDFGDNSAASTEENPMHTYGRTGDFTITLSVTSSTGDVATSTSTITVGNRYAVALGVTQVQFTNESGAPWDEDGSGPEILFGFFPSDADDPTFSTFVLGDDLTTSNLPITGTIDVSRHVLLTNTDWTFVFLDNDDPLSNPNVSDVMTSFELNPVTINSEKNYQNGEGQFEFTSSDGYTIIIAFDIR